MSGLASAERESAQRESAEREPAEHASARYYRLPRRRRLWLGILGWSVWALVGVATAAFAGAYIFLDDTLSAAAPDTPEARAARRSVTPVLPGEPVNVLLIGTDSRAGEIGLSDTLILVRMDSRGDFISMLSFPRDLYVPIPGAGSDKINAAFSIGGAALAIDTVEALTGAPVNHYLVVDFGGFRSLVDEVGGVYLDVDRRYFNENVGTAATNFANIDLEPGYQRLNGEDALAYVRYRHTDDDFSRIARQQQFLSDLKRQTRQLDNLRNVTAFRRIFAESIETSIRKPRQFLSLLDLALTLPDNKIARLSIEGSVGLVGESSVVIASSEEIQTKLDEWRDPEFSELEETAPAPVDPGTVDTVVLNGNGQAEGAERIADVLRGEGFATRNGGNADGFGYLESVVLFGPDTFDAAKRVQTLLGPSAGLEPLADGRADDADVVVIAGATFDGTLYEPPPPPPPPPPATTDTESLVLPQLRRAQRALDLPVLVPLKVATGSRLRRLEVYNIIDPGGDRSPAVKLVFDVVDGAGRAHYWGIMMTTMEDPPILEGHTGVISSGGRDYLTFYDGRNLQRLAFQVGGTTYWVSNSLDYELSARTIQEIAKSMRPIRRAMLPPRRPPTAIEVELDATTL